MRSRPQLPDCSSPDSPSPAALSSAQSSGEAKKPSLSLRVTPPVGFAPLKTRLVVDVRNGDDDFADFYCPTVEWDWGDGTVSANSEDCDPYEAGKSVIQRRFSTEHTFRQPGAYRVAFRLKQKDRVVGDEQRQRAGPGRAVAVLMLTPEPAGGYDAPSSTRTSSSPPRQARSSTPRIRPAIPPIASATSPGSASPGHMPSTDASTVMPMMIA